ncbi:MAG: hypothetical protein HGB12_06180 [Bacteroidetes bacterium]|nr:hypothetical protein [Bacteroidota bacterium]
MKFIKIFKIHIKKISLIAFFALMPWLVKSQYCYKTPPFEKKISVSRSLIQADSIKHSKKKKNKNGFYFGANLGFYFANSYTAQYYNGSGINIDGSKANNLNNVLNSPYNRQEIINLLGYDFDNPGEEQLPSKMKYNPGFLIGPYIKYYIKNFGIFAQFNFAKLKTNDIFTIIIHDQFYNTSEPTYKQEAIYGAEQRANIDIGFSYTFNTGGKNKPYIEFGYNLNNTKFLESKIKIEGTEYSIVNPYYSYHQIDQAGVGMGAFGGGGVELIFNESISINPGFNIYYSKINLGTYYDKYKLNYSFFVRAILNGLL